MKKLILLYFLLAALTTSAQETLFVNAPSGLIIREKPSKASERIGKFEYGDRIKVIEKTSIDIKIIDDDKIIPGYWTKVEGIKHQQKGFVFSGYLSPEAINKGDETKEFYLTKLHPFVLKKYWENLSNGIKTKPISVYLRNKKHQDLFQFSIVNLESYENTTLKGRNIKGLINISKIIIIESNYSACCSNTEENYYLVDTNNELIELPLIENTHCDGPEPYEGYIFPNDDNGKKNKVIYAKISPRENGEKDKVEVLKTFSWENLRQI